MLRDPSAFSFGVFAKEELRASVPVFPSFRWLARSIRFFPELLGGLPEGNDMAAVAEAIWPVRRVTAIAPPGRGGHVDVVLLAA